MNCTDSWSRITHGHNGGKDDGNRFRKHDKNWTKSRAENRCCREGATRADGAENTDNFFTVLNRFADLLNNPHPARPSFLPIPTVQESATLEAVNNPVSFTPYTNFNNVLSELEAQNISIDVEVDDLTDNLDILWRKKFFSWIPA